MLNRARNHDLQITRRRQRKPTPPPNAAVSLKRRMAAPRHHSVRRSFTIKDTVDNSNKANMVKIGERDKELGRNISAVGRGVKFNLIFIHTFL